MSRFAIETIGDATLSDKRARDMNCEGCGEFFSPHYGSLECFETFGKSYCESCMEEAFASETESALEENQ